jgi:endoglucanase
LPLGVALSHKLSRRDLLRAGIAGGASLLLENAWTPDANASLVSPGKWHGFNLPDKMDYRHEKPYLESDFDLIANWRFNFVRLPVDYRCWSQVGSGKGDRDRALGQLDQAFEWARQRNIHICLALYKAPGFAQNNLANSVPWIHDAEYAQFAAEWKMLASRYAHLPFDRLSFNLINEPRQISSDAYARAMEPAIAAIRSVSPDRIIIADGIDWGYSPVPELAKSGVIESTRGYKPLALTHYEAQWVPSSKGFHLPQWPLKLPDGQVWNKARLAKELIDPWQAVQAAGVHVHVGEFGAYNKTPHSVVLAWMKDNLELWREAGWGWALWNLRGDFGVLDSGRSDVKYQDFHGHKLDRAMLDLLLSMRAHA